MLEQGDTGWEKIQSVFSAARHVGRRRSAGLCRAGRAGAELAARLAWLWRSDAAFELKAAALASGSLLATPYVLDYDLVVLAVAIALLARHGFAPRLPRFEISLLAAAWLVPLLTRGVAGVTGIPLGLLCCCCCSPCALRRAVRDRAASIARQIAQA